MELTNTNKSNDLTFFIEEGLFKGRLTSKSSLRILLGGNRGGGIPETIPNSEVKPSIADGTMHKSMEE
jgi:hypothetical protein